MKKILLTAAMAVFLIACDNDKKESTKTDETTQTTTTTYSPSDGDVSYRGGRLVVYKNNEWVDADGDVTVENGIIVRKSGRVSKDNEEYELEEGVVVTKKGDFWDKAGNTVQDGWEGIKKAFRKVKEEVKDALSSDTTTKKN